MVTCCSCHSATHFTHVTHFTHHVTHFTHMTHVTQFTHVTHETHMTHMTLVTHVTHFTKAFLSLSLTHRKGEILCLQQIHIFALLVLYHRCLRRSKYKSESWQCQRLRSTGLKSTDCPDGSNKLESVYQ